MVRTTGREDNAPMFQDAFVKLGKKEVKDILDRVNPLIHGMKFSPKTAVVMSYAPPFYPGYSFLDIAEYESLPPLKRFAVVGNNSVKLLNWTNEPIYELNSEVPLSININNITDYLRFFFAFVKGRHGRFLIAETVDDINWREEPPPAARKAIGKMLTPLEPEETGDGGFLVKACLMFKDSLFKCEVTVLKDGTVNIGNEELLIEEMPVLDDVFGQ